MRRDAVANAPLTSRLLARLPGASPVWIALWALVPWLNAAGNLLLAADERSAIWEQSAAVVALNYAALSFAVAVALVGADRLARRIAALEPTTATMLRDVPRRTFRGVGSARGPALAATATAVAFAGTALVRDGWAPALLRGTTWLVVGLALWSFVWVYGAVQLGLGRLGRARLRHDAAPLDPSLGLRPLGALAFLSLWSLLAWLVPILVTGVPDLVGVAIGLALLAAGLGAFVFSLYGLHEQIVEVKQGRLELARRLYAEAYEPVQRERTLDALERRQSLLGAADALEKRARALHEWPVGEATWAWLIGIATSVVAIAAARMILNPLGL